MQFVYLKYRIYGKGAMLRKTILFILFTILVVISFGMNLFYKHSVKIMNDSLPANYFDEYNTKRFDSGFFSFYYLYRTNRKYRMNNVKEYNKKDWIIYSDVIKLLNYKFFKIRKNWYIHNYFLTYWLSKNITIETCFKILSKEWYFSNGVYGLKNASGFYFNKKINNLSKDEIITLIITMESPAYFNPLDNENRILKRKKQILEKISKIEQ